MSKKPKHFYARETKHTKVCTKCLEVLPLAAFDKRQKGRKGKHSWCKTCTAVHAAKKRVLKQFTRKELENLKELKKLETKDTKVCTKCHKIKKLSEFYISNSGQKGVQVTCKKCQRVRPKKYYIKHYLKQRYNLTIENYDNLLIAQGGGCAICGTSKCKAHSRFSVDHNHETGKIRGLLCMACNTTLGLMKDDPDRLEAAAKYLRK